MATNKGTIEWFASELANALKPLNQRLASGNILAFFEELGVTYPPQLLTITAFTTAVQSTITHCGQLPALLQTLNTDLSNNNVTALAADVQAIIQKVDDTITSFDDIQTELNNISSLPGLSQAQIQTLATQIIDGLTDYLIITHLEGYYPNVVTVLEFAGIIERNYVAEVIGPPAKPSYVQKKLYFARISDLFSDPSTHFQNIYNWDDPSFNGDKLLTNLKNLFQTFAIAAEFNDTTSGAYELKHTLLTLKPTANPDPKGLKLLLEKTLGSSLTATIPFSKDGWNLNIDTKGDLQTGISLLILPGGVLKLSHPNANFDALFSLNLVGQDANPANRFLILGKSGGSRMDAESVEIGLDSYFHWDSVIGKSIGELGVHAAINKGQIVLKSSGGDSFIQKLIPAEGLKFDFEVGIGWRSDIGFYFTGSGSLEVQLPIHFSTPAFSVDAAYLTIALDTSDLKIELSADTTFKLGPFVGKISRMGIEAPIEFQPGNLGPINAGINFKPPSGVGLTLKSETVKGGGFLSFDNVKGRYLGALELTIKDKISIKAIGILTTKLPSGQQGYSLLLMVTVEGFKPLQLGFGFTLNGVGGLIALNRRMNTQALRDGVRNGNIDNILFPKDPVANINSIVSSLETVFPVAEGRYSFGPMAIIGWGSPTLITAEVGLFFEAPNPQELAIIGVIRTTLPNNNKPLLKLQVAFAGIIDFSKKFITFDASLFDSTYLGIPLTGDMAFRLKWGDQSVFVLTVGGFHPKFSIPELNLPVMRRLSMCLPTKDKLRMLLESYFAVTSNTAQFGAKVDFLWEASSNLKLSGFLGFDTLFYFSPFRLLANIQGGLDVKYKGDAIVSLSFNGQLDGPAPWHLQGNVTFKILGVSKTIDFDQTFGKKELTTFSDIPVLPMLTAALQDSKNWQATMATDRPLLVTVRDFGTAGSGTVVVHPQGSIAVNQKIVPLDLTTERFGTRRPSDFFRFSLGINYSNNTGSALLPKTDLKEYFAPNEFFDLNEDERLARPSFEPMTSGIQVLNSANALTSSAYCQIQQDYELIYMDSRYKPIRPPNPKNITSDAFVILGGNGSAANSDLGSLQLGKSSIPQVNVAAISRQYAVAQTFDLALYTDPSNNSYSAGSKTEALAMLNNLLETYPELEGKLNVVQSFELA